MNGWRDRPSAGPISPTPTAPYYAASDAHECCQVYNVQVVVCTEGSQMVVANGGVATIADALSFAAV